MESTKPQALADITEAEKDLDISMGCIKLQEIRDYILKLKNGRAAGEDRVQVS